MNFLHQHDAGKAEHITRTALLTAFVCTGLAGTVSAAPSLQAPDATVADKLPAAQPGIQNTAPQSGLPESSVSFTLKELRIDTEGLALDDKALQRIADRYTGHSIRQADLNEAAAAVTRYCRAHGYPAAAAYLPVQDGKDGRLTMQLLPGHYGKILIDNQSQLHTAAVEALSHGLKSDAVIRTRPLETVLYNISSLGGIQAAGVLSPGMVVGSSDLTIRIRDGKRQSCILYSENYGSTSSGRYRYGLQQTLSNLDHQGSQLSSSGLLSNHDLRNYSLGWDMLAGHSGTRVGISVSRMNYELGGIFQSLGMEGKADTVSLYGTTPLWRTTDSSLAVSYGYDYRSLDDNLAGISAKKHSHALRLGLNGFERQGKGSMGYSMAVYTGTLGDDSDRARLLNTISDTAGRYTKGTADLNYIQVFDNRWDLMVKAQLQKASRNIDSSEEIFLGGASGVRAYPQGEGSGDEGWDGTAELRYSTGLPGLTLSTYLDGGHVNLTRDGSTGGETLKGWGIGVTYSQPGRWFARFDYARRIGGDEHLSDEAQSRSRMWFILGRIF